MADPLVFTVIAGDGRIIDWFAASELTTYNPDAKDPECSGSVWNEMSQWAYLAYKEDRKQRPWVYGDEHAGAA